MNLHEVTLNPIHAEFLAKAAFFCYYYEGKNVKVKLSL
jgi:hypothetical protein